MPNPAPALYASSAQLAESLSRARRRVDRLDRLLAQSRRDAELAVAASERLADLIELDALGREIAAFQQSQMEAWCP